MYSVQLAVSLIVAHRLAGLKWTGHAARNVGVFALVALATLASSFILSDGQEIALGSVVTAAVSCYCLRQMIRRLGSNHRVAIYALRVPVLGRWLTAP
jgi:hypothetical protein